MYINKLTIHRITPCLGGEMTSPSRSEMPRSIKLYYILMNVKICYCNSGTNCVENCGINNRCIFMQYDLKQKEFESSP